MDREQVLAMLRAKDGDVQLAPVIALVESDGAELQRLTDDVTRLNGEVETLRTASTGNVKDSVAQALSLQERALKAESALEGVVGRLGVERADILKELDRLAGVEMESASNLTAVQTELESATSLIASRETRLRDRITGVAELVEGSGLDKAALMARLEDMDFEALDAELESWSVKLREAYQTPQLTPQGEPQTEIGRALDLSGYRV